MDVVGTRIEGAGDIVGLIDRLAVEGGAASIDVASAYWDASALAYARELAGLVLGGVRLVLWTAGGSRPAWLAARAAVTEEAGVELRFIDSPEGGGIFHAKLAGAVRGDGTWGCALVGSGNLTDAAMRRNVELGVVVQHDAESLEQLRSWFEVQWAAATPAAEIDWEHALRVVPETSEAAVRRKIFAAAALATPAPAGPIVPPRAWAAG